MLGCKVESLGLGAVGVLRKALLLSFLKVSNCALICATFNCNVPKADLGRELDFFMVLEVSFKFSLISSKLSKD